MTATAGLDLAGLVGAGHPAEHAFTDAVEDYLERGDEFTLAKAVLEGLRLLQQVTSTDLETVLSAAAA